MNSTQPMIECYSEAEAAGQATNTLFLLISGILVVFMQTGFAMLEAGVIQQSHLRNIILKNVLDVCVASLSWWVCGYAFAFGDGNAFIGASNFFATGLFGFENRQRFASSIAECGKANLDNPAIWFFQFAFAATTATIVSGAVAERIKFQGYLVFTMIFTAFSYPVVSHWVWSTSGWLSSFNEAGEKDANIAVAGGAMDFAGGIVVHMCGGVAALVGAWVLGFRNQFSMDRVKFPPRFEYVQGKWIVNKLPPSSEALAALGVFILFVGWYGFNAGSTNAVYSSNGMISAVLTSLVTVNTTVAAGSCTMSAVLLGVLLNDGHNADLGDALNGLLSGLVVVTPMAAFVQPWVAFVCGLIGGFVYKGFSKLLIRLRIDDPLDASAVHGACGFFGSVMLGFFADPSLAQNLVKRTDGYGIFYGGDGTLLGAQLLACFMVFIWAGVTSAAVFYALKVFDSKRLEPIFTVHRETTDENLGFGDSKQREEDKELKAVVAQAVAAGSPQIKSLDQIGEASTDESLSSSTYDEDESSFGKSPSSRSHSHSHARSRDTSSTPGRKKTKRRAKRK